MEKFPLGPDKASFQHRFLEDVSACDAAFLDCIDDSGCVDCFSQLDNADVDWSGSMSSDTRCDDCKWSCRPLFIALLTIAAILTIFDVESYLFCLFL